MAAATAAPMKTPTALSERLIPVKLLNQVALTPTAVPAADDSAMTGMSRCCSSHAAIVTTTTLVAMAAATWLALGLLGFSAKPKANSQEIAQAAPIAIQLIPVRM